VKPISVQLYSLREESKQDFVGVLKNVASIGFKGVEPAGLYGLKPAEARKIVEDLGMVVSSNHGPWPNRDNLAEVIDVAKGLGTDTVVTGFGPDDFKTLDAIKATADTANFITNTLAKAGITVALHNHFWEFDKVEGRIAYDILMDRCPLLKSELDIYWVSNFGKCDAPTEIRKNAKRTVLMHVKDGPLVKDQPMTAVGTGKVNIPDCVAAADEKVLRWLIVELDACATDMLQAVADSYRYLVRTKLAAGNKPA